MKMNYNEYEIAMKMNYNEYEDVEGNFLFVMNRMIISAENINECIVLL